MPRMRVRPAIAASLVSFAMAQEPPAVQVTGRVLGPDRKGIPAATVELLHRRIPFAPDGGAEDRVRVVSNQAGVFRAEVTAGRRYTLRAFWTDGASRVEEGVEAGSFVTLLADPQAHARKVTVEGLEPFAARGPFRLRAIVGGESIDFVDAPIDGGLAVLPPMPAFEQRPFEVLDAAGTAFWCGSPGAAPTHEVDGAMQLTVPPPYELELRVCDAESSAPLAGARIQFHIRNHWITGAQRYAFGERFRAVWPDLGSTDPEGRLRVHLPLPAEARAGELPSKLWLLAHREGYRSDLSGWEGGKAVRAGTLLPTAPAALEIRLEAAGQMRTKLVEAEGKGPLRATKALLGWRVYVRGEGVGLGTPFFELADIVDGTLVHAAPAQGARLESLVLDDPAQRRFNWQGNAPESELALHVPGEEFREVEVLLPDGRPGSRVLLFAELDSKAQARNDARVVRADRLGRALVSVRGPTRVLAADGLAYGTLHIDPGGRGALRIQMRPRPVQRVRVLDDAGEPVPSALLVVRFVNQPLAWDEEISETQKAILLRWADAVATDADGRAQIPFAPVPAAIHVQLRDPRRPLLDAGKEQIEDPGETEHTLRWTLPRD